MLYNIIMTKEEIINTKLESLSKSKFRSSFKLRKKDILYAKEKGYEVIKSHAYDFIRERLAPLNPNNDGKQTPMNGHPVFIAQHATGTCCRGCLYKWHHIPKDRCLTENEINFVVSIIMAWIVKNME